MKRIACALIIALLSLIITFAIVNFLNRRNRISAQTDRPSRDKLAELSTLPYINWIPLKKSEENIKGVTRHDTELSYKGVNVYCSRRYPGALITDMNGQVLHEFVDKRKSRKRGEGQLWHLIEPYRENRFLVIVEGKAIFLMDWDSKIVWKKDITAHHDVAIAENGDIFSLALRVVRDDRIRSDETITDNKIVILNGEGEIKGEISFAEVVARNQKLLSAARNKNRLLQRHMYYKKALNIFHANTIEIIRRDVTIDSQRVFKKGNILFCLRNLDTIGVLDIEKQEILWDWGPGRLDCPHNPSLLDNGNVLVFDNGAFRKYSRVIEINPLHGTIEWEYRGTPVDPFFTRTMGFAQRLPNQNTLISEGDRGRVFEVTPDGKIVWEFYNPELRARTKKGKRKQRGTIYRMIRYPAGLFQAWQSPGV
jgi:hypothetical protein